MSSEWARSLRRWDGMRRALAIASATRPERRHEKAEHTRTNEFVRGTQNGDSGRRSQASRLASRRGEARDLMRNVTEGHFEQREAQPSVAIRRLSEGGIDV